MNISQPLKHDYNAALAEFREAERAMLNYHDLPETTEAKRKRLVSHYKRTLATVGKLSNEFPQATTSEILKGFTEQAGMF